MDDRTQKEWAPGMGLHVREDFAEQRLLVADIFFYILPCLFVGLPWYFPHVPLVVWGVTQITLLLIGRFGLRVTQTSNM